MKKKEKKMTLDTTFRNKYRAYLLLSYIHCIIRFAKMRYYFLKIIRVYFSKVVDWCLICLFFI